MKLELFNTNCEQNEIPKNYSKIADLNITLKASQNIFNPIVILTRKDEINYSRINYAKLGEKFYTVSIIQQGNYNLVYLSLTEDVLQTYAEAILNSDADIISKSTIDYNSTVPTNSKVKTKIFKSNVTLPEVETIVVQTNGTTSDPIYL